MKKLVTATVSAALCTLNVSSAVAQEYRPGIDAPRGATMTFNLRVPLGGDRGEAAQRMSYGMTLGYGQELDSPTLDRRTRTRTVNLADIRFNRDGDLRNVRFVGFDLAALDRSGAMHFGGSGTKRKNILLLYAIFGAAAAGVGSCLIIFDCFEDDEDSPGTPGTPTG